MAEGDLRLPIAVLADAIHLIDFGQPVALLLVAVLHFVSDDERPHEAVQVLVDALPPGSYLAISHGTPDDVPGQVSQALADVYASSSAQVTPRSREQVVRFFDGLELLEPGVVSIADWRPGQPPGRPPQAPGQTLAYGGVAIKRLQQRDNRTNRPC